MGRLVVYLDESEIEYQNLRQGDILSNIHAVAAINLNSILYSKTQGSEEIAPSWIVPSEPRFEFVMVLSHSCEIDKANDVKLTSIILSPIRDIDKATETDRVEELKNSNYLTEEGRPSYLKYFYLEPHEKMPFDNGAVVDYSKCFSVRKQSYDLLLSHKILQLQSEVTDKMSLKLAIYFHR